MKTHRRKMFTVAVGCAVFATVTAGCGGNSEPKNGPAIGVDAIGANTSAYVTQVRSFATMEGHVPQTQAELLKATGGQKLPETQLKVTYLYNPSDPNAFCFVSTSVNTTAVYDSILGGNQPATTTQCSNGFVPLPAENNSSTDPYNNPESLLSR